MHMKKKAGFEQLSYRGIPIEIREDCPPGVIYFKNTNPEKEDERVIWAMRCLANDIECKRTWPWQWYVWKFRRFVSRLTAKRE